MTVYHKSAPMGAWLKGAAVASGTKAKLVSETMPQASQFMDKNGNPKTQDVAKIRLQGETEALNISINRASIDAMVDAFGSDSKNWIGKIITLMTEKIQVGGRRVTAVYLIPEGYEMSEDDNGYILIMRSGGATKENIPEKLSEDQIHPDLDNDEVDIKNIPF